MVWNYSLREFLFLLHQDCSPEFIKNSSKNVLKALLVRYPHIGYCQGMNYIVTFLLCFCHEETCFWLICYVIEKILPAKFFQKSEKGTGLIGVLSEAFIISSFINNVILPNFSPFPSSLLRSILLLSPSPSFFFIYLNDSIKK